MKIIAILISILQIISIKTIGQAKNQIEIKRIDNKSSVNIVQNGTQNNFNLASDDDVDRLIEILSKVSNSLDMFLKSSTNSINELRKGQKTTSKEITEIKRNLILQVTNNKSKTIQEIEQEIIRIANEKKELVNQINEYKSQIKNTNELIIEAKRRLHSLDFDNYQKFLDSIVSDSKAKIRSLRISQINTLTKLAKFDRALELTNELLNQDSSDIETQLLNARLLIQTGNSENAINRLKEIERQIPDDDIRKINVYEFLIDLYQEKSIDSTIAYLNKAISVLPNNVAGAAREQLLLINTGKIYLQQNKKEIALDLFKETLNTNIEIKKDNPDIFAVIIAVRIAGVLSSFNEIEKATEYYYKAKELLTEVNDQSKAKFIVSINLKLAEIMINKRNFEAAISLLNENLILISVKTVDDEMDLFSTRFLKTISLVNLKKKEEAKKLVNEIKTTVHKFKINKQKDIEILESITNEK